MTDEAKLKGIVDHFKTNPPSPEEFKTIGLYYAMSRAAKKRLLEASAPFERDGQWTLETKTAEEFMVEHFASEMVRGLEPLDSATDIRTRKIYDRFFAD